MIRSISTYSNEISKTQELEICEILDSAFNHAIYSHNVKTSFFTGYQSPYPNVILLQEEDTLLGIAFVAERTIHFLNKSIPTLTIGPLAIHPNHQKKGYSQKLFDEIDQLCKQRQIPISYLSGIDDYYHRFDYFKCLSKSKLQFPYQDKNLNSCVTVKGLSKYYYNEVRSIYAEYSRDFSCSAIRTDDDWKWLFNYATKSWSFFSPQVIFEDEQVHAYFCSDPENPSRLREVACRPNLNSAEKLFNGLTTYMNENGLSSVDIMTPSSSWIYKQAEKRHDATFIRYIKRNGGQLLKIHNNSRIQKELFDHFGLHLSDFPKEELPAILSGHKVNPALNLNPPFIFQGDNY
jgi:predicted N-acetyltransferase YhbS